jgi:hypothetical protein
LDIIKQFDIKLGKNGMEKYNRVLKDKDSSISTTNQTSVSGEQYYLSKKLQDSHITITSE